MKTHIKLFLAAVFVSAGLLAVGNAPSASANSGVCFFNTTAGPVTGTTGCGEAGLGDYGTNDLFHYSNTGRYTNGSGSAIPNSRVGWNTASDKTQFINMIKGAWNGSTQNSVSAHFLVQSMLPGNDHSWPTTADLNTWVAAMQQSNVSLSSRHDSSVGNTSWYDNDKHNIFYSAHDNVGRDVIEIKQDGNLLAQIERPCGNLVQLSYHTIELDKPWTVKAVTDDATHASPLEAGVTVHWKHHLTNLGPNSTDAAVDPHVVTVRIKDGNTTTLADSNKTNIAKPWAKGSANTKDYNGSYDITHADEGAKVCQYIEATPGSNAGGTVKSTRDCVSVPAVQLACSKNDTAPDYAFWSLKAHIETNQEVVRLGNTMKWSHEVKNLGPDNTDLDITEGYGNAGGYGGTGTVRNITGVLSPGEVRDDDTTHVATQDDVGRTYYRTTSANPGGRGWSAWSDWANVPVGTDNRVTSSASESIPDNTSNHQYQRVFLKTQYTGNIRVRTKHRDGTYSDWSTSGTWGWSDTNEAGPISDTKKKTLTDTRNRYILQERTRHKEAKPKIETGGCGIYVPYDYQLVPTVNTDKVTAEADSQINITGNIHNVGPTKSEAVSWKITQIVYDRGADLPDNTSPAVGSSDACAVYGGGSVSCGVKKNGSIASVSTAPDASVSASSYVPNVDAGGHVCYVLSINPWRNRYGTDGGRPGDGPDTWSHSVVGCVVIARKPKVHVLDGDLKVRGKIVTSTSRIGSSGDGTNQKTYGSWVDYGVFSQGTNSLIASGAGLNGGNTSSSAPTWSQLTFANTPTAGGYTLGTYSSLYDYFSGLTGTVTTGGHVVLDGTGNKVLHFNSNVTIDASTINPGTTYIIQAPGYTVTIDGGIEYDTSTSIGAINDIPQVVVVADNINITNDTKQIDAWLLAGNSINTCKESPTGSLTVGDCDNSLTINGPVATNQLHVRRTAGSTAANPEAAAETFRLTPWTYLWLYDYAQRGGNVITTYVTEEPPRF